MSALQFNPMQARLCLQGQQLHVCLAKGARLCPSSLPGEGAPGYCKERRHDHTYTPKSHFLGQNQAAALVGLVTRVIFRAVPRPSTQPILVLISLHLKLRGPNTRT